MTENTTKKARLLLTSGAGIILVAGIVAAVNIIAHYAYFRLDFSSGRIYSVSAPTRKILNEAQSPVLIKVYYSKDLPPQIATMKSYLLDLVREYATVSGGKVKVTRVEVGETDAEKETVMKAGILPVRFDIYSKEKYEQREGVFGLAIQYKDKNDVLPFINDISGLEYNLTSRIKALASTSKPAIGFLTGRGALTPYLLDQSLFRKMQDQYDLETIDLNVAVSSPIPSNIKALFLLGPEDALSEQEIFALDQYLLSGRALCLALDTKRANLRMFNALENKTGIDAFLAHHGIKIKGTMVMDAQSQSIQVARQQGIFTMRNIVKYPPFVIATDLNREHIITKDLDSIILPFASPLEISPDAGFSRMDILARSSKTSWADSAEGKMLSIDPFSDFGYSSKNAIKGPFVLALAGEKRFSPFMPSPPAASKFPAPASAAQGTGRLAVIATSKFLNTEYNMPASNYLFFMNLSDWLSQDSDLISIRSKSADFHPLREISPLSKKLVRYINMFLPPLFALLIGLAMWKYNSTRRARNADAFGTKEAGR